MQRIYRQLLLFTSLVVFMALAPLIIFYAMGYRISNIADTTLPAIGVLLIDTTPRRANVTVDSRDVGRTPQSVSNLPPGAIPVTVEREGYQPWRKQVTIEPGAVTEFRNIRLFPGQLQSAELLRPAATFSLAPNRRLLAVRSSSMLHLIDQAGEAIAPPVPLAAPFEQLLWSPDNNHVLLIGGAPTALFSLTASTRPRPLPPLAGAAHIVWDQRVPGRILYQTPAGHLAAYHIATDTATILVRDITAFATSSRHIVTASPAATTLTVRSLQGHPQRQVTLPEPARELLVTPAGQIAVHYASGALDVVGDNDQLLRAADRVQKAGFAPSGQMLYLQLDDTSLHVYNVSDTRLRHIPLEQQQIVVRLSRPIRDPQWFAGGQHLIYQVDDEIIITEIDTRDYPVSYTADTTNLGASAASVGEEGEAIYYLKKEAGETRLVSARLLLE